MNGEKFEENMRAIMKGELAPPLEHLHGFGESSKSPPKVVLEHLKKLKFKLDEWSVIEDEEPRWMGIHSKGEDQFLITVTQLTLEYVIEILSSVEIIKIPTWEA